MTAAEVAPPSEIRRCARCGQAALVVVHAWQHKIVGVFTGTRTLDLRCQACGIEVALHPADTIQAERIVGFLLLPAIIPGIIFLVSARKKARAWTDNPVVVGADPLDAPRAIPPARRCDCSGAAQCTAVVREGTSTRSLGGRHDHRCARCGKTFAVHDLTGVIFPCVVAGVMFAGGALMIGHPPGATVGAEESNRWSGVGMVMLGVMALVMFALRVRRRIAHPVVSE